MVFSPLKVAWISDFPVEWLEDAPEPARNLPKQHPMAWLRALLKEFEGIRQLQLHVLIVRKQVEKDFSFERHGVVFHLIRAPGGLRAPSLFWIDTLLIRRCLKRIQPDLVHALGTEKGAALVATRLGFPYLVTIQGLMTWYDEVIRLNGYERFMAVLERFTLRRVPFVTSESKFPAQYLKTKYPHSSVRQIEHAPDPSFHQIQRVPQTTPLRFIFVGSFEYRKGADLLLLALDQLRKEMAFELVVLSQASSAAMEKLKPSCSPELWQRIQFKPTQTSAMVADELARATMMIFPTRADTGPIAVKEAVVAGVPVVGSSIGGIPDYIVPEKNGLLFSSGNLSECVQAIRTACVHPLFSRGLVDTATLADKRDYLSAAHMGQNFLSAYHEVLKKS